MQSPVVMARYACSLSSLSRARAGRGRASGYTLIEILVATALTLLLMAGLVTLFGSVLESVSRGQAMMEIVDRVRATQHRLQTDLKYITAPMIPPLDPKEGKGSFEVVEGPGPAFDFVGVNAVRQAGVLPVNSEISNGPDTSVGDIDDWFMCTARSFGEPFLGKFTYKDNVNTSAGETADGSDGQGNYKLRSTTVQSQVAEIAWFMRGTTLYRRVLLVVSPEAIDYDRRTNQWDPLPTQPAFYRDFDISVRQEGGPSPPETRANWGGQRLVVNSLGDLTKRENRYGHHPTAFPHDARGWGQLGLPLLRECSATNWPYPLYGGNPNFPAGIPYGGQVDYWRAPHPWNGVNAETGTLSAFDDPNDPNNKLQRTAEDAILTNVLSFDIKVWDPDAPVLVASGLTVLPGDPGYIPALRNWAVGDEVSFGAYVDLYYLRGTGLTRNDLINRVANTPQAGRLFWFAGPGQTRSGLRAINNNDAAVYDLGSLHYERDGINQDGDNLVDEGSDGLDNDDMRGADDAGSGQPLNNDWDNIDSGEHETLPPYPVPLRGVQIKIRVYERDSRQIREVTVTQDFLK